MNAQININWFITNQILLKDTNGDYFRDPTAEWLKICATAITVPMNALSKCHRFESDKAFKIGEITQKHIDEFLSSIELWCELNMDKFMPVTDIPPRLEIKMI